MRIHEVVKIGGSLLAEPDAMTRLRDWLIATRVESEARLLIAGGGPVVDGLRRIDEANPLTPEASHWAAIRLMDANTRLLVDWLPGTELVTAPLIATPGDKAFACHAWLRDVEPAAGGERLAIGWQTTSDSIAARIATRCDARLTVLKHTLEATYGTPSEAAQAGAVDAEFPRHLAEGIPCRLLGVVRPGLPGRD